ncbi:TM2 domain protein [Nonomuraea coxensis DSM 45129]|uniref:TM2 domain protein n=1 Tax=Nonomuraea coxensis DSM 45129 TaxID=1122611 RepID=A0ABX8U8X2_9ACTN|nr:TM2 domain-containing protein [Nonomuraea coxensis]QYC43122.1 TM2 domain protein [Nonomuraea coxensis DSM 45129]
MGKSWVVAVLLCFFLGALGVHRFYVGKIGTGILQLVTLGGLGVWVLIDFIMILIGKFDDKQGRPLAK